MQQQFADRHVMILILLKIQGSLIFPVAKLSGHVQLHIFLQRFASIFIPRPAGLSGAVTTPTIL